MSDQLPNIEYMNEQLTLPAPLHGAGPGSESAEVRAHGVAPEPLERLEARICELAGHLTAATCQFLLLIADFDERRGWADWEMASCAAWLSWKCQVAPGTAREQVRVARSLAQYPLIRQEFAAGRLSYAKARALTRIVSPETEADLVAMATPMTAGQLERFAQAHRRVSEADRDRPRPAPRLTWGPAGDLDYQFRAILPAEAAAVVFQALRAARNDLEHPHDDRDHGDGEHDHAGDGESDVSAETRLERLGRRDTAAGTSLTGAEPPRAEMESTENLAQALVEICADYLSARAATADNPDTYQVIIHAGVRAITGAGPGTGTKQGAPELAAIPEPADVSAETPGPRRPAAGSARPALPFWHPAHEDRCHLQDGPALSPASLALIGCNATISTMIHDLSGAIIDVGRRTRKPPPALRRALRERDRGRCQYPGCASRRTDAHHIRHWANGGQTNLANLISFCKGHHRLVHEKGYIIAATATGFAFYAKDGIPVPGCPQLPRGPGDITTAHDAAITPTTINPPHSGERLNLSLAIWIAFANARAQAERHGATRADRATASR
jgi:HNH endonuclease